MPYSQLNQIYSWCFILAIKTKSLENYSTDFYRKASKIITKQQFFREL